MKRIKLTEQQLMLFKRLIKEEDAPNFENGTVKDYNDDGESGKIAPENTTDIDGNTKHGSAVKQLGADEIWTAQNYWYNGVGGMRRMP
jgi:hypothetical protein